jgi:hypothetical protein
MMRRVPFTGLVQPFRRALALVHEVGADEGHVVPPGCAWVPSTRRSSRITGMPARFGGHHGGHQRPLLPRRQEDQVTRCAIMN